MKREIKQLNELKKLGKSLRLAAEWGKSWQSLISTILSARTRDDKTIAVSNILYKKYSTIEKLAKGRYSDVAAIIKPVNFYKTKTRNIINCAKQIVSLYGSRVPRDFSKLIELSGIGRKTANVFLAEQGGAHIGIDTHVGYISKYLGWTKHEKQADVERDLERLFPRKMWRSINYTLVRFGQTYRGKREKNRILDEVKRMRQLAPRLNLL